MESPKGLKRLFYFNFADDPVGAFGTACLWVALIVPISVPLIWGVYDPTDFRSVIGIAARRGSGAFVNETKPVGESLLNGTAGRGFRPGQAGSTRDSLRPGLYDSAADNNGKRW